MTTDTRHLLDQLDAMLDEDLLDDELVSDEAVHDALTQAGFDPDRIGAQATRLVARTRGGALDWKQRARQKADRARALLSRPPRRAGAPRHQLLERLEAIRRQGEDDPRVAAFFRKVELAQASNAMLEDLLDDLEVLLELEGEHG